MRFFAENAFETQMYFVFLAGDMDIPERPPSMLRCECDPHALKERLNRDNDAAACLLRWLKGRNVNLPYPPKASSEASPIIFILSLEGTIMSLPYYEKVILPQAVGHLTQYMETHYPNDEKLLRLMEETCFLAAEVKAEMERDRVDGFVDPEHTARVRRYFVELVRREVQKGLCVPCIKHLIGEVWADRCDKGNDEGPTKVFADVPAFLRMCGQLHCRVVLFAASSAASQRRFLQRTQYGDLRAGVMDYTDTTMVGGKLSPRSYTKLRHHISERVGGSSKEPLKLVFVSDNLTEVSSAEASGAVDCALLCLRPFSKWLSLEALTAVGVPHVCTLEQLVNPDASVDHVAIVEDAKKIIV